MGLLRWFTLSLEPAGAQLSATGGSPSGNRDTTEGSREEGWRGWDRLLDIAILEARIPLNF